MYLLLSFLYEAWCIITSVIRCIINQHRSILNLDLSSTKRNPIFLDVFFILIFLHIKKKFTPQDIWSHLILDICRFRIKSIKNLFSCLSRHHLHFFYANVMLHVVTQCYALQYLPISPPYWIVSTSLLLVQLYNDLSSNVVIHKWFWFLTLNMFFKILKILQYLLYMVFSNHIKILAFQKYGESISLSISK